MSISAILLIGIGLIAGIAIFNILLLILEWVIACILDLIRIARSKPHNIDVIYHDVRAIATQIVMKVSFGIDSPKHVDTENTMKQMIQAETEKYISIHLPAIVHNYMRKNKGVRK